MSDRAPTPRLHDLDRLRAALVILVVLHHVALVYGAAAPFYYVEPPFDEPGAFVGFLLFALLNQAWFMGALFLLAGYFVPGALARHGAAGFARARLVRLGVPTLVFIFVLSPIASLGFYLMPASLTGITAPPGWASYVHLIDLGPMWFAAMLLVFDLGASIWWRATAPGDKADRRAFPGWVAVAAFTVLLAAASYLLRMVVPLGREVSLVGDFLSFPTLAYLPQYLAFYVLGIVAARADWHDALPARFGVAGIVAALAAFALLLPPALSGAMFSLAPLNPPRFTGGGTLESALYAAWDSITAVGLTLGAIVVFRRVVRRDGAPGRFLARQGYGVYLLHAPIIVFVAYGLRGIDLPAVAKFALAAAIVVPLAFAAAWLVRRLPPVAKIL